MSFPKERREETSFLPSHTSWGAETVTATVASGVHTYCLEVSGAYKHCLEVKMKMKMKTSEM
eukprot:12461458-Ditylum_brightwellii.AAC.1